MLHLVRWHFKVNLPIHVLSPWQKYSWGRCLLKSLDLATIVLSPSFGGVRRLPALFDDLDLGNILSQKKKFEPGVQLSSWVRLLLSPLQSWPGSPPGFSLVFTTLSVMALIWITTSSKRFCSSTSGFWASSPHADWRRGRAQLAVDPRELNIREITELIARKKGKRSSWSDQGIYCK